MTTNNQQIQFAETIRAMKIALRRRTSSADDSDSDGSLHAATNRGHKLNGRARHIREGRLNTTGDQSYKRKVVHAGYERHIISKRPKLYDEDGEAYLPEDIPDDADEDGFPDVEPIEPDPFGDVRLELLLRPLTSAADLPEHPSLSQAYTSKALSQMAEEAAEMVRREKATLWKAKRLLERFRGDGMWMACERFTTDQDALLLQDEDEGPDTALQSLALEDTSQQEIHADVAEPGLGEDAQQPPNDTSNEGEAMNGVETQDHVAPGPANVASQEDIKQNGTDNSAPSNGVDANERSTADEQPQAHELLDHDDPSDDNSASRSSVNAPSHRMTTRARARSPQLATSPSPAPSDSGSASIPSIHPWFLAPPAALSDRDLGLPAHEAEDTRKLLLLYVQKQENVVRQLESLYTGLQRTDRLRKQVWQACKAEAHMIPTPDGKGVMTEMSDGEDWCDVTDWNLSASELKDGRLEKGKDEVEDPAEEEGRRVGGRRRRVVGRQGVAAAAAAAAMAGDTHK
nr:hypothetical protein CFP56_62524 [Quercus suber]